MPTFTLLLLEVLVVMSLYQNRTDPIVTYRAVLGDDHLHRAARPRRQGVINDAILDTLTSGLAHFAVKQDASML